MVSSPLLITVMIQAWNGGNSQMVAVCKLILCHISKFTKSTSSGAFDDIIQQTSKANKQNRKITKYKFYLLYTKYSDVCK